MNKFTPNLHKRCLLCLTCIFGPPFLADIIREQALIAISDEGRERVFLKIQKKFISSPDDLQNIRLKNK